MNGSILTAEPPCCVTVGGRDYEINTDYRTWLKFSALLSDGKIDEERKIALVFGLCYKNSVPKDGAAALGALCDFFAMKDGKTRAPHKPERRTAVGKRATESGGCIDFEADAPYIYAAFLQAYGIDLTQVQNLHWFLFLSLFRSLPDDCKISKIIGWRTADLSKMSGEMREQYARLKEFYALPDMRTDEERNAAIGDAVAAGITL